MNSQAGLPRILVPMQPLLESDTTRMVLITVELWPDRVHLRAVAAPIETIAPTLDNGTRPMFPLQLQDDVDTVYTFRSGMSGGTDREPLLEWIFRPGVPTGATTLTVSTPRIDAAPPVALDVRSN
jgi:hypothetical protein